jgi:hypothetical protein
MYRKAYTILPLLAGLVCTLVALVPVNTWGEALPAGVVLVEGATKTFQVRDMDGKMVEVEIPSQSSQDIKTSRSDRAQPVGSPMARADRTVPATVVAVDLPRNLVRVRTHYGQTVVITTPGDLQVGEQLTLVVPR